MVYAGSAAVSSRLRFVELTMSWTSISCSSEHFCAERTRVRLDGEV